MWKNILRIGRSSWESMKFNSEGNKRRMKKLFLHICCAPCAEYPVQYLRQEGYELMAYFYNPNIQPQKELDRRLENVRIFSEKYKLPLHMDDQSAETMWRNFKSDSKQDHCKVCYALRMDNVAKKCKALGYEQFTTVLTVSPWQDHEEIKRAGEQAAKRHGVEFVYMDFRAGYREGQEMAKADGLYRQRYCGCIYSLGESNFKVKIAKQLALALEDIPSRQA